MAQKSDPSFEFPDPTDQEFDIVRSKQIKNTELIKERRRQILDAALALILSKGYHATTLRDISEETGINVSSIYDYFHNKADILRVLFHEMLGPHENHPARQVVVKDIATLREYFKRVLWYSWTNRPANILLGYRETHSLEPEAKQQVLARDYEIVNIAADKIAVVCGLPADNERVLALANMATYINSFVPLRSWNMKDIDMEVLLDIAVDMIVKEVEALSLMNPKREDAPGKA